MSAGGTLDSLLQRTPGFLTHTDYCTPVSFSKQGTNVSLFPPKKQMEHFKESPFLRCFIRNRFLRRSERYSMTVTKIIFASWFCSLPFQQDCRHSPQPANCLASNSRYGSVPPILTSVFAELVSATLAIPLVNLFERRLYSGKVSDKRKQKVMCSWLLKGFQYLDFRDRLQ